MFVSRKSPRTGVMALGMIASFLVAFAAACDATDARNDDASGRPIPPGAITTITPLTDEQRAERYQAGPEWDGKGNGPWTMTDVQAFNTYAVYWVGPSLGPYNLQAVSHTAYEAPKQITDEYRHDQDVVMLIYGRCTIDAGAESCSVPVSIQVQPICLVPPGLVAHMSGAEPETVRGGAVMRRFTDGHARIWTGDAAIRIDAAADSSLLDEAISAIERINRGGGTMTDPLPAPDLFNCDSA